MHFNPSQLYLKHIQYTHTVYIWKSKPQLFSLQQLYVPTKAGCSVVRYSIKYSSFMSLYRSVMRCCTVTCNPVWCAVKKCSLPLALCCVVVCMGHIENSCFLCVLAVIIVLQCSKMPIIAHRMNSV